MVYIFRTQHPTPGKRFFSNPFDSIHPHPAQVFTPIKGTHTDRLPYRKFCLILLRTHCQHDFLKLRTSGEHLFLQTVNLSRHPYFLQRFAPLKRGGPDITDRIRQRDLCHFCISIKSAPCYDLHLFWDRYLP